VVNNQNAKNTTGVTSSGRLTQKAGGVAGKTNCRNPNKPAKASAASALSQRILKDSAETHREALERLAKR